MAMMGSLLLAGLLGWASPPAAEAEAEAEAGPQAQLRELGRVVTVEGGADRAPPPAETLARLHAYAPGLTLTLSSPGGLGRFSGVALRRGGSLTIPIVLDGAPLHGSGAGPVELEGVPLGELAEVELHRAHPPLRHGFGAVELRGALYGGPPRLWAEAGVGSSWTRALRGGFVLALRPRLSLAGAVDYAGSRGNFRYFDDGGTPQLAGDDLLRRRASNYHDRGGASLRLDHRRGPVQASTLVFGQWQLAGVPAPNRARPSGATLSSVSLRSISRVERALSQPGAHLEWVASVAGDGRVYRDPKAAFGSAADDERTMSLEFWLAPRLRLPIWRQGWVALSSELRGEWVDVRERASALDPAQLSSGDARRRRLIAGVGAELEQWLYDRRWVILPGVRVDLLADQFAVPAGQGEFDDRGQDRAVLGLSPRFATQFLINEGLALHASALRTLRPPTLLELFGDRGVIAGNEGLRAEVSSKVDGGLRFTGEGLGGRAVDLYAQVTGFVAWTSDAIHWVRSEAVLGPVNVANARVRGLELGASLRAFAGDLAIDWGYTLVDGRNTTNEFDQRGRALPGLARHNLLLRPSGGHRFAAPGANSRRPGRGVSLEPRLSYELDYASASVLDLGGRDPLPARLLHALAASLRIADSVELLVEVRGLSHRRWAEVSPGGWPGPYPAALSDAMGFPLPGPSVWTSIRVDLRLRQAVKAPYSDPR